MHCLICTHDSGGRAASEGEYIHIRQRTVLQLIFYTLKNQFKSLKKIGTNAMQETCNRDGNMQY